ncbi:tumor necrosis factor receptor superfamily member 5 [Halichoeres trimaculatus]|uniref:tumor necrosis factor receptor superfamily member 5 n=1 Tax=Halichoeres trimaculatus TaxID=147232 RepID=UPI003D9E250D
MLRSTTRHMKMHLFMLFAFIVLASAQRRCDQDIEYEKNGECCKMCAPGTRMLRTGSCDEPRCEECGENDYQDTYTTDSKCKRQPYCDPNRNFNRTTHMSKTQETKCKCKLGFHCSSTECITCVPHTVCPPGKGATTEGSHSQDTVCEECPDGTFSNESSWSGVCKAHTKCENDYHIKEAGTSTSDNICEMNSRSHVIGIVLGVLCGIIFFLGIAGVIAYRMKGGAEGNFKEFKNCLNPTGAGEKEPLGEVKVIANPAEEESMLHPEEEGPMVSTPEENDDSQSLDTSLVLGYTFNGQPVQQDMTKTEQLSQEESQSTNL